MKFNGAKEVVEYKLVLIFVLQVVGLDHERSIRWTGNDIDFCVSTPVVELIQTMNVLVGGKSQN